MSQNNHWKYCGWRSDEWGAEPPATPTLHMKRQAHQQKMREQQEQKQWRKEINAKKRKGKK